MTTLGLWEMHGLLFQAPLSGKWRIFSFAAGLFLPLGTYLWGITGLNFALFISFFAALSLMMLSSPLDRDQIGRIALLSFAWLYLPYFISFVLLIGAAPQGRFWILFVLAVTVAGDAGAYHTGSRIGRHKLYQIVSPKKTIEGAIGGLFSSVVAGSIMGLIFLRNVPLASTVLLQPGGRRYRTDRGPDRVHAEAQLRQEGFEHTPSGPRRYSGQAGLPDFLFPDYVGAFTMGRSA